MLPVFAPLTPGVRLADQVARLLETEIRDGRLQPGDRLPTEAVLVEQFGVSRTVTVSYTHLTLPTICSV